MAALTTASEVNGTSAHDAPASEVNAATSAQAPPTATTAAAAIVAPDPVVTAQAKYAKEVNSYISEYIRFADLKAGAALTLTAAVGGGLGSAIPKIIASANGSTGATVVFAVLLLIVAITAVMTILFATLALIPRVPPTTSRSLNSFPDIAKMGPDAYAAELGALTEREITRNLAMHNVTLSQVAQKKFDAISTAIKSLMCLLFSGFVVVVFYVLGST